MSNLKENFEKTLKEKLQQKSTIHTSEETLLMKYFKYFDLDNSNTVSKSEWARAIEKIGVVVESTSDLEEIFDGYDKDKSGYLDYKEFAASIFGDESRAARQLQVKPTACLAHQTRAEEIIEYIRCKVFHRGVSGLIGLARCYYAQDPGKSQLISINEFVKGFKDYRITLPDSDADFIFKYIDEQNTGKINYKDFIKYLEGPMSSFRVDVVKKAYEKIAAENHPVNVSTIGQYFNAAAHPDVRSSKKTKDDVINEFIGSFESHHGMFGSKNSPVGLGEFLEYYAYVSAVVENDVYFDQVLNSCWRLYEAPIVQESKVERIATIGCDMNNPLEKLKARLASRGARGILGLSKQFQIMDDDGSRTLSPSEFFKACRDFRIEISEEEVREIFKTIDRDRSGYIDYDELLRALRGPMNSFRRAIVEQVWKRLDKDQNGVLDIDDIRSLYSASKHPEVRSGKKTEESVLNEFLDTFETHHNIAGSGDHKVTKEEFLEYYSNISSSIDDDAYFELMMSSAWRIKEEGVKNVPWAGATSSGSFNPNHKNQWLLDHHRSQFGGTVISSAPFGTSEEPIDYTTNLRPGKNEGDLLIMSQNIQPAGNPSWASNRFMNSIENIRNANLPPEELFNKFKEKLVSRGARGIIGLSRQFKIMDDNNNKSLEFPEFAKALKDFRVDYNEDDLGKLFKYFDANGTGSIDYEEFIHRLKGELSPARKNLVQVAYKKLDKNSDGCVTVDDLRGVYNASTHPDVRLGKKTEDEVLCEFLDTLEVHHAMFKGGDRDSKVTFDEFCEYYAHISASIEDDRYFELMMKNAWNLDNKSYGRGWKGEV
ncbi:hypothetical protein SteCoe_11872 [Stentor coeruleus]|uniref:EF-hand domain-containing protein n=1 Tax=Stentor coeruleus TaxID=5963 RepID=A0A1R2CC70_9CILI|nr:hypothetical protein SteCoe_11872 [Stentor coeruleus]